MDSIHLIHKNKVSWIRSIHVSVRVTSYAARLCGEAVVSKVRSVLYGSRVPPPTTYSVLVVLQLSHDSCNHAQRPIVESVPPSTPSPRLSPPLPSPPLDHLGGSPHCRGQARAQVIGCTCSCSCSCSSVFVFVPWSSCQPFWSYLSAIGYGNVW